MPPYLVKKPIESGQTHKDGANAVVVFANSADDAKAMARAQYSGDSNASWDGATVVELVAGADLEGYRLRVAVLDITPVIDVTVVGEAADTIDDIAALAVIALNGTAIDASSYDAGTNILTIAAIADNIGDKTAFVEFLPPVSMPGADKAPIPDFVGAIVDQGIAGAVLTVQLGTDAIVVPNFVERVKIE